MHEPLVHCDLLGHVSEEGRSETVVIVVLTGLRLLTVDASSWRVQLNLQLRKVQSVYQDGSNNVLVLQLMPRRRQNLEPKPPTDGPSGAAVGGSGGGGGSTTGGSTGETRRLLCHTEEATAVMLAQLQAPCAALQCAACCVLRAARCVLRAAAACRATLARAACCLRRVRAACHPPPESCPLLCSLLQSSYCCHPPPATRRSRPATCPLPTGDALPARAAAHLARLDERTLERRLQPG